MRLLDLINFILKICDLLPKQFEFANTISFEARWQIFIADQFLHLFIPIFVKIWVLKLPPSLNLFDQLILYSVVDEITSVPNGFLVLMQ